MKAIFKKIAVLIPLLLVGNLVFAQSDTSLSASTRFYIIVAFVFVVALLILAVSIVVLQLLKLIVREQAERLAKERGEEYVEEKGWWNNFVARINYTVPIERESEIMLDHDYDGIRELDNHLPPWWKWMFYLSIVFAVVYMCAYHLFNTLPLQTEEYQTELAEAAERKAALLASLPEAVIDENNVEQLVDAGALAKGASTYESSCATCHKSNGAGAAGPNLTDDYWLHGGSMTDIYLTIKNGVPEKGMVSWEAFLSPTQMQQVASYVMTLHGTNPPDGKKPQGELYIAPVEETDVDSLNVNMGDSLKIAEGNSAVSEEI